MVNIDYVVKWGDAMSGYNNMINLTFSNYSYVTNINENSSISLIKKFYEVLEAESSQEQEETKQKKYEDLTESYVVLKHKIKADCRKMTAPEKWYIMVLLDKREEDIKKYCSSVLSERKLITTANQKDDRDYLYYINSLAWHNVKLDNFKEVLDVLTRKKTSGKIQYVLRETTNLKQPDLESNFHACEFLVDIK